MKNETELKLFCVDDGEKYWIAHESKEALLERIEEWFDIEPEDIEELYEVDPSEVFTICMTDGIDDSEVYPTEPYQDEHGRWCVKATVQEWLACSEVGAMIASTVY